MLLFCLLEAEYEYRYNESGDWMKIIVGLGNPGKEYEKTRHNAGFLAVDRVADKLQCAIVQKKFKALVGSVKVNGENVIVVKPQTFMNLSGEAVREVMDYYKAGMEDLIVLSDDLDLPIGRIRIRGSGSDGGQRGLRSIIQNLQSNAFARIRIGIGKDKQIDTKDYVLGKISASDQAEFLDALDRASAAAIQFIHAPVSVLMNQFNTHGSKE